MRDGDKCNIGDPELVRGRGNEPSRAVREDRVIVLTVGGAHEASQRPHLEALLPHNAGGRLVIYIHSLNTQLGRDAPVAIAGKFRAELRDSLLQRVSDRALASIGTRNKVPPCRGHRRGSAPRVKCSLIPQNGELAPFVTKDRYGYERRPNIHMLPLTSPKGRREGCHEIFSDWLIIC